MSAAPRFYVIVASLDHVEVGVAGGFVQACHGAAAPLRRLRPGDGVVMYSPQRHFAGRDAPRRAVPPAERCRAFTALGHVADAPVEQADMGGGFVPWRRAVRFRRVSPAPIAPLVDALAFIRDKVRWSAPFRFGFLEIPAPDFATIAAALGVDPAMPAPGSSTWLPVTAGAAEGTPACPAPLSRPAATRAPRAGRRRHDAPTGRP